MRKRAEGPAAIHRPSLSFLLYVCVVSSLGGFLWGFDAIVISGTIEQVKEQFLLNSFMEGAFVSSGLLGAVIGAALAGLLSDRFGRSRNLVLAAALLLLSAAASGWARSIEFLILARWTGGLGVGIAAMVCPVYISELSPAHLRGRMVTLFQFAITLGILTALLSNAWLHSLSASLAGRIDAGFWQWLLIDENWRAMFATELIPGVAFLGLSLTLPESPRWLAKAGSWKQAHLVLQRILREGAQDELQDIRSAVEAESKSKARYIDVFKPSYRKPLAISVLLSVFAQLSGINVVFYYGPSILEQAGFEIGGALSGFATIGFFNMLFTLVAIWMVDNLGRRPLMLWGTIGCIGCLCGIGLLIDKTDGLGVLIALICGFVACFAFSLGPIKFVFASEIFPTNIRSHAVSVAILAMWATDTLVGQCFPLLREGVGPATTFFIFAAILVPQIWLVLKYMPETAGRSLEEIEGWWHKQQ